MADLQLSFACETYGHVQALADGRVKPEGIALTRIHLTPSETLPRLVRDREFDVAEMGLTFYLGMLARGDAPYVALPVFPSRSFRHSAIYVRADSPVERPEDLAGKRFGEAYTYGHDGGLWAKGLLADEYGVQPSASRWVVGGVDAPMPRWDWVPFAPPPGLEVEYLDGRGTLSELLASGEIDALVSANPPAGLAGGGVRRIFSDTESVERAYFARTGVFPIMHAIAVRRSLYEQHPWIAASLYAAFVEAKAVVDRLYAYWEGTLHRLLMIPWVTELRRKNRELFGADCWPYGVEPNRKALETAVRYHVEQGLSPREIAVEDLFAVRG